MAISGTASSPQDLVNHVGWTSERSAQFYCRTKTLTDGSKLAADIANVSADSNEVEEFYKLHGDFSSLDSAFVPSI